MFPIVQAVPRDDRFDLAVAGTGFFVGHDGLFLTAQHVMRCVPGACMLYYGNLPDGVCEPVEIECVATDVSQDLYLGRVQRDYVPPVELSMPPVRPGDAVCFGGYPMSALSTNSYGSVRRYWQASFAVDADDFVIDERTYTGYLLQHACLRGMCGGPVFDASGKVRGMAAATLIRTVAECENSATVLRNAVVLDVEHLQSFIQQHID